MTLFTDKVPLLVSIVFMVAFAFPITLVSSLVKGTSLHKQRKYIGSFYGGYLLLVSILCLYGVFDVVSLPPRIIVVTTLPLLAFYLLLIANTPFYRTFWREVPLARLIRVHIFRLLGSFFLILYFFEQLPLIFALVAGLGDLITATSSLWVAKALQQQRKYAKTAVLVWNTFGLLDIFATSTLAILFTKQRIATGSLGVDILGAFPFCFIPAFAPATIIFLHLTIYRKVFYEK
ncbi:MAG: hypothetical protein AAGF77_04065 [Bacteroidota bacterium]